MKMLLTQVQGRNAGPSPSPSGTRLLQRMLSGGCVAVAEVGAAKTAAFSGFLSDTCLSAAHIPPTTSPSELGGPPGTSPDMLGALNLLGASKMLSSSSGEASLSPSRKRKDLTTARPGLAGRCLPLGCEQLSLPPPPANASCPQEGEVFSSKRPVCVLMAVDSPSKGGEKAQASASHRPNKKGSMMLPQLLQLPVLAANSKGGSSVRRNKDLLVSPSCHILDMAASPLSAISQASTTCALLSSASSLASCSQPPTPICGLLDASAASSPLPFRGIPLSLPALSAETAAEATAPATYEAPSREGPQGGRMRMRDACKHEVRIYGGDSSSSPEQQKSETAAGAAAGVGPIKSAAPPAVAKGADSSAGTKGILQLAKPTSPLDESTVATSFLSSPKATAVPSPLRLPIPARGLRRLQHPRLQQQAAAATTAAEEPEAAANAQPPRSLRRLQLPKLRAPPSPEHSSVCALRGKCTDRGECNNLKQRHAREHLTSAKDAPECMYSQADEPFRPLSLSLPAERAACGDGCGHGAPAAARGGALGDAFEAAAHAAHVAAHAAARAAAHAAAHAAVLKRRAVEAYWCSRSVQHPTFSIYPDLDRDIHLDYNLYCAAWPDGAAESLPANSSQETTDSMAVDVPPSAMPNTPGGDPKGNRKSHGHLVLGEGRYGKVVLAEHKCRHEMVAVKMLDKRRALADDAWDCRQELEMHRQLPRHNHVVSVLDVYEDRKSLYIVMELCDRNTLVDRIVSDGAFTEEQAKLIFAQLLSGVMHCHNNNIVHRDLKPENILFAREVNRNAYSSPPHASCKHHSSASRSFPSFPSSFEPSCPSARGSTPTVKITDFGSACYAVPGELSGTACGTIHYLAPEVLTGNYYDGFLSDIWSLGVILFIIISATPPFFGESDGEVVQKIVAGSYSMSGYQWRHVSEECKDIIRRLLTVDPRCRISLNEAITHSWFIRAMGGMSWPISSLGCLHCSVEDSYENVGNEGPMGGDFEGPCCCGKHRGDPCEASPLVRKPPCFPCCPPSTGTEPWGNAHAGGFIEWHPN